METPMTQSNPHNPPLSLSVSDLVAERAQGRFPIVIDVRRGERYDADKAVIRGAIRRPPETANAWADELPPGPVVVYCVFGHEVSQSAAQALAAKGRDARYLVGGITAWREAGLPLAAKPETQPQRWITRARPKIDRIACPWLLRRFVLPEAQIIYAPSESVKTEAARRDAIPFDIPDTAFSHVGEACSFDAFLAHFGLQDDPALTALATIIRGADTGRLDLAPEASGLLALSIGLSAKYQDDHAMLDAAMPVYDAFYARMAKAADGGMAGRRQEPETMETQQKSPRPSFSEATKLWLKIGLLSFGGPAGQIALMHRLLVDEKKWIGEAQFLHALNFCMLLPGPEAQQLATYIGWLLHRTKGAVVAGLLFILPGLAVILTLSAIYMLWRDVPLIGGMFFGLQAAVLALVIEALRKVAARAVKTRFLMLLAAMAFIAIWALRLPFPLIVLGAAIIGLAVGAIRPSWMASASASKDADVLPSPPPSARHGFGVLLIWGSLWAAPVLAALLLLGNEHVFSRIGLFFSEMAVVTFGGAYAVLAYVGQQAVQAYGWLLPGEMLHGLGLAETTPGPLILVLSFVGFVAGFREAGIEPPLVGGLLGGLLATWVTFAPCFLWILLGAPYVERARHIRALRDALSAITAAVVGVILNLAVWFALHALFRQSGAVNLGPLHVDSPVWSSLDWRMALLSAAALLAVFRFKLGIGWLLAGAAIAGMLLNTAW